MGDDDKKKPLLAKDGTSVEIPKEYGRTVPTGSHWARDLQNKLALVAVIDVVANLALWLSFFCLVGGRSPPAPAPGPSNGTSNTTDFLAASAQAHARARASCASTLWSQDIVHFSFKTSNVEFVATSVCRAAVLLLLAFSSSWAPSERVDRVMESVALWLTGLIFIALVAKDMLYEASLYSIPVLAVSDGE